MARVDAARESLRPCDPRVELEALMLAQELERIAEAVGAGDLLATTHLVLTRAAAMLRRPPSGTAAPDGEWWQEYERRVGALESSERDWAMLQFPTTTDAEERDACRRALDAHVRGAAAQREPDAFAVRLPNGEMMTDPSGRVLTYPTAKRAEGAAAWEVYDPKACVVHVYFGQPVPTEATAGGIVSRRTPEQEQSP